MINFYDVIKDETKEHNPNLPEVPDHPYRIWIIGCCGSGKTSSLFNLINQQPDIDKTYLYTKDQYEANWQFLINKRESGGLSLLMILKILLNTQMMWMIFIKTLKNKILIVFDDMIADMLSNKTFNPIVTELFIRQRKLNLFLVLLHNLILLFQNVLD